MGQKVLPIGIRLGITRNWSSRWYAPKQEYGKLLAEDQKIRRFIKRDFKVSEDRRRREPQTLASAGIPLIEIEREGEGESRKVTITLHSARPGVVIGRKGATVDRLKDELAKITGAKIQLNIAEVANPLLNAQLVGEDIAEKLVRRQPFRRLLKNTVREVQEAGAGGVKIMISGRLGGAEMSRREVQALGKIPLSTLRADIDYGFAEARTTYGVIGCKVWIYKGEVLKEKGKQRHADAQEG